MKSIISRQMFLMLSLLFISYQATMAQAQKNDAGYKVVINHEEQYSIWPIDKITSEGWKETRVTGDLAKCRNYIEEVWTDMRPLSIKKLNLPKDTPYMVVINHEEQYSIWPADRPLPRNCKSTRTKGTLDQCMKYIEEVWTDMRPLSIRKRSN